MCCSGVEMAFRSSLKPTAVDFDEAEMEVTLRFPADLPLDQKIAIMGQHRATMLGWFKGHFDKDE